MSNPVFAAADILLPNNQTDVTKWAVMACDQFTSQPEYWEKVDEIVGGAPSTLRIILPEVYLEEPGVDTRIGAIHAAMADYQKNVLTRLVKGFIYIERHISTGVRQGLVGCVDLEEYEYDRSKTPRIRPSENTVVERIPPRLAVRRGGVLESPHILMLVDDAGGTVIEPLGKKKDSLEKVYDLDLMLGGGRLAGWAVTDPADIDAVYKAIAALEDEATFNKKYGTSGETPPFPLAVGDGNHSLATAKASWEELKSNLTPAELAGHPARYCLVELENVQSPANAIEPIHRVAFDVTGEDLAAAIDAFAAENGATVGESGDQTFTVVTAQGKRQVGITGAPHPLTVGTVQGILEVLEKQKPVMRVDYIHGEDSVDELVAKGGAVGILLPPFNKADLFRGVALGGVLPKKTFSMGHAEEKRYYLECRTIL